MMKNEDGINFHFLRVISHLGHPDNRNSYFLKNQLFEQLEIPKNFYSDVWNKLWYDSPRMIDANEKQLRNPEMKINHAGLKFIEQVEDGYYKEHGEPMYPRYGKALPLDETCEVLFQMHKEETDFKVLWTRETYIGKPENLNVAKDKLLHDKVIKQYPSKHKITQLNLDLLNTTSYKEALTVLEDRKQKEFSNVYNDHSTKVEGDYINAPKNKGIVGKNLKDIEQTNNPAPKVSEKKPWWKQALGWIWEQIKKPIVAAISAYLLGFFTPHPKPKEDGKSSTQSQPQSTAQQATGDTLGKIETVDSLHH